MTEEQKQSLIDDCKASIARIEKTLPHWQRSIYTLPYLESELARQKIALAALTAPPIMKPYLPDDCDRTEAHYKYAATIRAAGYQLEGE